MADTPDNKDTTPKPEATSDDANAPSEQPQADAEQANSAEQLAEQANSAEQLAEQSLDSVERAADSISKETGSGDHDRTGAKAVDLPSFDTNGHAGQEAAGLGMLNDIDLNVRVELGRTRMYIEDVLRLNANSIVELDKAAGDPVDIFVNDRLVARGEVLVLSDNFCVRVSEIIKQSDGEEEDD
jgi:flagellar motor switch protein FliN/FliY